MWILAYFDLWHLSLRFLQSWSYICHVRCMAQRRRSWGCQNSNKKHGTNRPGYAKLWASRILSQALSCNIHKMEESGVPPEQHMFFSIIGKSVGCMEIRSLRCRSSTNAGNVSLLQFPYVCLCSLHDYIVIDPESRSGLFRLAWPQVKFPLMQQ